MSSFRRAVALVSTSLPSSSSSSSVNAAGVVSSCKRQAKEHRQAALAAAAIACNKSLMNHPYIISIIASSCNHDSSSSNNRSVLRWWLTGLGMAAAVGLRATSEDVENCGIVGIVGTEPNAREYLVEGLSILRNRGYDSAGLATVDEDNNLLITKFASRGASADSFALLKANSDKHATHTVGIGHTRWATHGGKTDKNAHPHMDYKNRIALVHNGTINNAVELRKYCESKGIEFRSETDTEVIAHLIGLELDKGGDHISLKEATARALALCNGTWGLAIIHKDRKSDVVLACNGSPMVIGLAQDQIFVASEHAAFSKYTKNFIAMKDGEIGVISTTGHSLDIGRVEVAPDQVIETDPAPYPHWTLRECLLQPEAIARSLAFGGRFSDGRVVLGGLDKNEDKLRALRNMVVVACGTSLYAAQYGVKLMRDLHSLDTVMALDAAEMRSTDLPRRGGGMLVVSQSGETRDVLKALKHAEEAGIPRLSVVNVVGSAVARATQLGVYLNAGRETGVASTKAFTTQVAVLSLLTLWFRQLREKEVELTGEYLPDKSALFEALQRLPISFGTAMRCREQCKVVAEKLRHKETCFVLGKGYGEPVAYEGALKLKEMGYIHAEGYSGGALKHGPFALISGKSDKAGPTPIIMIILDDEHAQQMITCAEEVKARGADIIVITDNPKLAEGLDKSPIVIPSNGPLTALIAVLPLQLIAYELAILKGHNPDTPRNLAKAVTTD